MALGIIILNDFDKIKKTTKPAIIVNNAVLVPDWNIPHITITEVIRKKYLSNFNFEVIPNIINAIAEALALHPYVAAS